MENERVNIDAGDEKLNLSVWALASSSIIRQGKEHGMGGPLTLKLDGNTINYFDVIINLKPGDDMELERIMTEHVLATCLGSPPGPRDISFEEMCDFLRGASNLQVDLSHECQQLLRAYFLSSRKIRENSISGTEISLVTMEVSCFLLLLSLTTFSFGD